MLPKVSTNSFGECTAWLATAVAGWFATEPLGVCWWFRLILQAGHSRIPTPRGRALREPGHVPLAGLSRAFRPE
jgi:hypothetical protein